MVEAGCQDQRAAVSGALTVFTSGLWGGYTAGMTQWQYDNETAVTEVAPGHWSTRLSSAWNIDTNPNGGYASAPGLRAMGQVVGQPAPVSVTTYYLRPGLGDQPGDIYTECVRSGRRTATAAASLYQDGKERLRMMAAFADPDVQSNGSAPSSLSIPAVELPPPEQCRSRTDMAQGQGVDLPITSRLEIRIDPSLSDPGEAGRAEVAGWVRFADQRPPDAASLVLLADAFPPSVFGLFGRVGWVPTVELTVHVRRAPVSGWIAARFRTQDLANGMLIEDGELWDESGALVARSRQLALLLKKD